MDPQDFLLFILGLVTIVVLTKAIFFPTKMQRLSDIEWSPNPPPRYRKTGKKSILIPQIHYVGRLYYNNDDNAKLNTLIEQEIERLTHIKAVNFSIKVYMPRLQVHIYTYQEYHVYIEYQVPMSLQTKENQPSNDLD